jgi:hypothetical protein
MQMSADALLDHIPYGKGSSDLKVRLQIELLEDARDTAQGNDQPARADLAILLLKRETAVNNQF